MPNPFATIRGQQAKLFRASEPPVYLLDDGRFAVRWGGRWVVKSSLKSIDNLVKARRRALKLMQLSSDSDQHPEHVEVMTIAAFNAGDRFLTGVDGTKCYRGYQPLYLFDPSRAKRLADLKDRRAKAKKAFDKEHAAIMKGAKVVTAENFEAMLKKHGSMPEPDKESDG